MFPFRRMVVMAATIQGVQIFQIMGRGCGERGWG
jgi:hypothetical protein